MRILGFSRKWDKLRQDKFTTFRFTRKDKDWGVNEVVQVVYKPRSKEREILGIAEIIKKEPRWVKEFSLDDIPIFTENEANADGFRSRLEMFMWVADTHRGRNMKEPMNKLTLRWRL